MCFIQKLYRGKRTIIWHSSNLILNLLLLEDATRPGLNPRSSVPFIVPITGKREKKLLQWRPLLLDWALRWATLVVFVTEKFSKLAGTTPAEGGRYVSSQLIFCCCCKSNNRMLIPNKFTRNRWRSLNVENGLLRHLKV